MASRIQSKIIGLASICLALFLSGCNGAATAELTTTPTPGEVSNGYPEPGITEFVPPYPADYSEEEVFQANLTPVAPTPAVSESFGGLSVLLTYANTEERPVLGQLIYAVEMKPVPNIEGGFIPVLDETVAPSGFTDSMGQLHIGSIPVGQYALALMSPLGPILLEDEASGEAVVLDITANEVTDLGTIAVRLDPAPLEP
ncbi:MAG TPA: hypothetical protein VMN57_02270 [Anaerolineales bacterium]|nr:hypothetical protein [Anaerolineales bacterium]